MKIRTRRILIGVGLAAALVLTSVGVVLVRQARVGTAYTAKIASSAVFVAGRDRASIVANGDLDIVSFVNWEVDRDAKSVTAWLGPVRRTAVFREGVGTAIQLDVRRDELRRVHAPAAPAGGRDDPRPWPTGDVLPHQSIAQGVNAKGLQELLDKTFAETNVDPKRQRRTRAVVVLQDGQIVVERYAPGFTRHTPLIGWSMTKSLLSALTGIVVQQGKLSVMDTEVLPEWSDPTDPRREITVDQLLRMSSGLQFAEVYDNPLADVSQMLFASGDAAKYAATKSLELRPDTQWKYSSGSSNIISNILRRAISDDQVYHALPRRALFDRIGMRHAVIETDFAGNFVGSSFSWATARDWARFGLLYLYEGVWLGERILPQGWVDYCRRPSPTAPQGCYGAHWWCNAGTPEHPEDRPMPNLPPDYYAARGFQGQSVNVFPSRRVVVVRLGMSGPDADLDEEEFLVEVLRSLAP